MQVPLIVSVVGGVGGRSLGRCMLQVVESDLPPLLQAYLIPNGIALKFHLISMNTCMDLQFVVATYTLNAARY